MIGFTIDTPTDVLHCELCDHFLLRSMTLKGRSDGSTYENVKINQSQYVYIEKCTLSGAYDNVIDMSPYNMATLFRIKSQVEATGVLM